jgi:3,4-dihydroxy-2-butanone 4-phosphate synthase
MESIIKEFSKGKPVIIMDDLERENEGDIVFPA